MKKLLLISIVILFSAISYGQNTFKNAINANGGINVTGALKVGSTTATESTLIGWNATKAKVDGAVDATQYFVSKGDTLGSNGKGRPTNYDLKYEPTNYEIWKLWKKGGSDISPLMPIYPIVNVGATALVNSRLYLYRFYTPDTTVVHGFRILQPASFSGTANNYNGIYLYRYSNDSIYAIGNTLNSATFWTNTINTSIDKPLTANVTIPPGFYAVAPLYNNSAQTTAPTLEATYSSPIMKCVTFTGGWRTSSYINGVTTPAASYKYTGNVAGESTIPHIILVY